MLVAALLDLLAQLTNVLAGVAGPVQQLADLRRPLRAQILGLGAIVPRQLSQVLPQQLPGVGIQDPHEARVPAHVHFAADPALWHAVVGPGHLDGAVEVARAYYGVPQGWIGREVHVRWDARFVRILDPNTGQLLREHLRQLPGHYRAKPEDLSPKRPPEISQLLHRARHAGKHVGQLCEQIEQRRHQHGAREILGVLSLVKKHGFGVVDDSCRLALEAGVATYRLVKKLTTRPRPGPSLRQVDELIRDLSQYRDLIDCRTQDPSHEPERTRPLATQAAPVGHG